LKHTLSSLLHHRTTIRWIALIDLNRMMRPNTLRQGRSGHGPSSQPSAAPSRQPCLSGAMGYRHGINLTFYDGDHDGGLSDGRFCVRFSLINCSICLFQSAWTVRADSIRNEFDSAVDFFCRSQTRGFLMREMMTIESSD
jgi:hypothetical protein